MAFALRATVVTNPGPLFAVPTVIGALWFGRRGGVITAIVSAALYTGARAINPGGSLTLAASGALLLGLYALLGYLVGRVAEQRQALSRMVDEQRFELGELRGLQQAIAPRHTPSRPSLELASCYVPAQQGAAGDFYLVTAGPGDCTIVVVGDVAGKGVEAARRAAFVRTAFANGAPFTDDPCRLLELANTALLERPSDQVMLVTCACIVFVPSEHRMTWALAGHPPPMWLDEGTELSQLTPAYPLGVEPNLECTSASTYFEPGAGLMAFTDGLSEARRGGGELFGTHRIANTLATLRGASPARVVRELRREAERFAGGALPDDLCIVALRAS
ncbi:MAG TPA: PP2C family protein-serine/threonine phosphatase [Thermoleophilaceae bacterium]|nr:PP2C family protein-serine/threonine phosphatase [Thermoleophilaceae bacterium]